MTSGASLAFEKFVSEYRNWLRVADEYPNSIESVAL